MVNKEEGTDWNYIEKIKEIIEKTDDEFGIVVGGGYTARKYAKEAREKGANEFEADESAIAATHENAEAVIKGFKGLAYSKEPKDFKDAREAIKKSRVIVMGGTIPGITTDTDATLLAECIGAKRLINISNVDGIYDKNPREFKDAKKYDEMTHEQLVELAAESDKRMAGTNFVFDILASKLSARSNIEVHFVSGKNLFDVEKAIKGEKHGGTVVKD